MSVFMDLLCEMLPLRSALQVEGNDLRKVLDRTIGEWMDSYSHPFDELFLSSASGGWLDAHGKDYGVPRRLNESDDDYRQRIIYEKLDELTAHLLMKSYNVQLYTYINRFNVLSNDMASDNPYITNMEYMGLVDDDTRTILNNKFMVDKNIYWADTLFGDYIIDINGNNVLDKYTSIYTKTHLQSYFYNKDSFKKIYLKLPSGVNFEYFLDENNGLVDVDLSLKSATLCRYLLADCPDLENVSLDLPSATEVYRLFYRDASLTNLRLNIPVVTNYSDMLWGCSNLEYINLTVSESNVSNMISYINGLNLQYLETLIINGEEVDLS